MRHVLLGLVLGDTMPGWRDAERLGSLRLSVDVALARLLELGWRRDLPWMRCERWLGVMAIGDIGLTRGRRPRGDRAAADRAHGSPRRLAAARARRLPLRFGARCYGKASNVRFVLAGGSKSRQVT